jgi:glucose 1-dehydrogenase
VRFKDKVVVITGSGRGIGRGIAKWFSKENARVIIAEIDQKLGGNTLNEIQSAGYEALFIKTDVSSEDSVSRCLNTIHEHYGKIDVLINNAAISQGDSFLATSLKKWKRTIDINLTGAFIMGQNVSKYMIEHSINGKIINISSINAYAAEKNACPYVASKGGINQLTKSMAVDLAPYNITVNAIAPGPIITEFNKNDFDTQPTKNAIEKGVPKGKPGNPIDVAVASGFLASEETNYINGTTLTVDGGFMSYLRMD